MASEFGFVSGRVTEANQHEFSEDLPKNHNKNLIK